jgi:hemoglobin-like flavoprotein
MLFKLLKNARILHRNKSKVDKEPDHTQLSEQSEKSATATNTAYEALSTNRPAESTPVSKIPITAKPNALEFPTTESILPILDSWAILQKTADYELVVSELMFRKLLELAPGVWPLFPFAKPNEDKEMAFNSRMFKLHSIKMISTLDYVVTSLLELDSSYLIELGDRHSRYGIEVEYFPAVIESILYALSQILKDEFTEDLQKHWKKVLNFMAASMTEGLLRAQQQHWY